MNSLFGSYISLAWFSNDLSVLIKITLRAIGVIFLLTVLLTPDITILFTQLGMPVLALIILILITWTSNAMCLYSGGLGFTKALHQRDNKRPLFTLLCGIAGSVLAAMGILDNFTDLLLMLTAAVPPIAGVIIGSYYWGVRAERRAGNISVINWKGIIAWGIGVGFMIIIQSDIKNIVGIVVSGLLYIAIERTILRFNQIKLPNSRKYKK